MASIMLSNGQRAFIDDADFFLVNQYSWCLDDDGYAMAYAIRNGKRTTVRLHRLVCGEPPGVQIDHYDHNLLNCQRSNLRIATHRQNQGNRIANKANKTSKYKGVCWIKQRKRWRAQLRNAPKTLWLGEFKSPVEAAKAYDRAAKNYFGEFALTNF